ncbi:hypothetical protein ACHAWC_007967 [Mediolabrus comicus]
MRDAATIAIIIIFAIEMLASYHRLQQQQQQRRRHLRHRGRRLINDLGLQQQSKLLNASLQQQNGEIVDTLNEQGKIEPEKNDITTLLLEVDASSSSSLNITAAAAAVTSSIKSLQLQPDNHGSSNATDSTLFTTPLTTTSQSNVSTTVFEDPSSSSSSSNMINNTTIVPELELAVNSFVDSTSSGSTPTTTLTPTSNHLPTYQPLIEPTTNQQSMPQTPYPIDTHWPTTDHASSNTGTPTIYITVPSSSPPSSSSPKPTVTTFFNLTYSTETPSSSTTSPTNPTSSPTTNATFYPTYSPTTYTKGERIRQRKKEREEERNRKKLGPTNSPTIVHKEFLEDVSPSKALPMILGLFLTLIGIGCCAWCV